MAIEGINGNQVALAQAAITPPKPEDSTTPSPEKTTLVSTPAYTVELTGAALAKSLKQSGQNPAQIALKMGIDVKTVDSYLNLKAATVIPTPAPVATPALAVTPTATPAPQAKQAATDTAATPQTYSPAEEATESGSQKAVETAQGKK